MNILGISALYHDSAAALVIDGQPVAAAQEERFTRKKHDSAFPREAVGFCLGHAGLRLGDIDHVVFYDKPFLKFERLLESYIASVPWGFQSFRAAMPVWLREKLFQKDLLLREFSKFDDGFAGADKLLFTEHHQAHAASAFFPSPFDEALVLTLDGVGEWVTTSAALGSGNKLNVIKEIHFPHSLGLLYSAFTYYVGFKVNSGEYKLMGLAPYGKPRFIETIKSHLVDIKEDGSFRLNQSYFDYVTGLRMTNKRFEQLFGRPPRRPDKDDLEPFHMDIAASIQAVTEDIVLRLTRSLAKTTGQRNLCLAGGVALNCVANGKVLRDGSFENIWIQPAAGDAGGALGAALAAYYARSGRPRQTTPGKDSMAGSYLGPEFSDSEIQRRLLAIGAKVQMLAESTLVEQTADALANGKAVGWFQGRMEFGPRALGGRSILADPRSPTMQKVLNLKIKFRESFRPFAPSVLREDVADWFELDGDSPYMLMVAAVRNERRVAMSGQDENLFGIDQLNVSRSEIPAVTHIDYSARIQTVHQHTNPRYHELLTEFKRRTGCPVLVNTSFNVRGEPIVGSPEDAFRCLMGTGMDALAIGNCWVAKDEQDPALAQDYSSAFELD